MRALLVKQFGYPNILSVDDVPDSQPGPGEVLVDVQAIGVNYPELRVIDGNYQILPELPFSPGKEFAGIVREVGEGVSTVRRGDRVIGQVEYGAYREQIVAAAAHGCPLPEEMSFREGAAFGLVYLTAYFGLVRRARLSEGETVLVTSAGGGVGSTAVQLATALGAAKVIAVGEIEDQLDMAKQQGTDHAMLADPGRLREEVRDVTSGEGPTWFSTWSEGLSSARSSVAPHGRVAWL